jgi:Lon protease-like protein
VTGHDRRWAHIADAELIPLFPLHAVLFPGGVQSLHVFEERYRLLITEKRDFGVVLIRLGSEVGPGRARELHEVGTIATLERVTPLPGDRFHVLIRGVTRFRLLSVDATSRPYLVGRIQLLPDPPLAGGPRLVNLLTRYLRVHGVEASPELVDRLNQRAVWLAGSVLQAELPRRQLLLETGDPALAEELLSEELARMSRLGRLGTPPTQPPSPN